MRIVFGGLGLFLLLGACAASAPPTLAGKDVACLRHQVYDLNTAFDRGVALCGDPKPDLTGSTGLQRLALAAKIPFTIRPIADAQIKQASDQPITGSLIPGQPSQGPAFVELSNAER
jgi:hypothetical protein